MEIYVNQDLMLVIKRSRSRPGHIELFSRVCGSNVVELVLKKARENRTDSNLSEAIKSDIIALEEAFIRMPNIMI